MGVDGAYLGSWSCGSTYASGTAGRQTLLEPEAVSGPMEERDLSATTQTSMWLVTIALLLLPRVSIDPQPSFVTQAANSTL